MICCRSPKQHMRVDHSEDNNFIRSCIARAIANIEQRNEVTINPTTVLWTITAPIFVSGVANVPVVPAESAVVMDGENDVSDRLFAGAEMGKHPRRADPSVGRHRSGIVGYADVRV